MCSYITRNVHRFQIAQNIQIFKRSSNPKEYQEVTYQSNALTHPWTMMIKLLNTIVADGAM
jgi:hypothetical protein